MDTINAGTATIGGLDGADRHLKYYSKLPDYYITKAEADINYVNGKRNSQRVVWSNDGLIFVTFNHYKTFFEIV